MANIDIMTLLVKCGLTASKSESTPCSTARWSVCRMERKSQILPTHLPEKIFWRRRNRSEKRKEKFPQGHCKIKYNYIK